MAMAYREIEAPVAKPPPRFLEDVTLDELWDLHEPGPKHARRI
jgi:hypothetical protein